MAQVTGTFSSYDAVGNLEDIEDVIYNIDPDETPFYSLIGSSKVSATRHDWQTDKLAAPNAANAQIEGDDYTFPTLTPTVRVANFTQISWKPIIVTETQDAVKKAGREKELAYQITKAGKELKLDMEAAMLSNIGSAAGNDTTARVSGGFAAWLATNAERGAGGADGGYDPNTGLVVAATNGTQRAFTKALLDDAMQDVYEAGGDPTTVMVSPANKRTFSTFMSDANVATFRTDTKGGKKPGTIMAAADAYLSDFGLVSVIPNRVMSPAAIGRNIFIITPDMVERGVLRPIQTDTPAKTGDANKRVIKTEYTLIVKNEAAHGVIADVNNGSASS